MGAAPGSYTDDSPFDDLPLFGTRRKSRCRTMGHRIKRTSLHRNPHRIIIFLIKSRLFVDFRPKKSRTPSAGPLSTASRQRRQRPPPTLGARPPASGRAQRRRRPRPRRRQRQREPTCPTSAAPTAPSRVAQPSGTPRSSPPSWRTRL